ncbi:MAG: Major facilitator superfamily 1 transporter [Candidatus Eremiobacteraeota bacterium]|nr:Major facilitator superfamily 1 transporter [Candidatus Eremiobacteraeota bacterium]
MTNRWGIAIAGTVVMVVLGTVYSWSIFTLPLVAAYNWSTQDVSLAFELAIFFLGLGAVVGGRWQDRVGPRTVTIVGIVLWGLGVMLAGLGTGSLGRVWLYLTYSIIGGFGNGMAYITPVAMVTKWFPDKRGLASGMVVMGFGLGAFFYSFFVPKIPAFAATAKAAGAFAAAKTAALNAGTTFNAAQYQLTPEQIATIWHVFLISGIAFIIVGGLAAMLMKNPPAAAKSGADLAPSYTPAQALRKGQLYGLWVLLFLNVVAGIMIISNAVPIYSELTGESAAVAASVYGLVSILNGLGRFFWGTVSDRIGRNLTYTVMYLLQAAMFVTLIRLHSIAAVSICFGIVLLCYGGGFGVMPSFSADFFGTKYYGQIYGFILTAWGVGGVVGPLIAARVKDATGSYRGTLLPVAIMLVVAAVIPFFVHKPAQKVLQRAEAA